MTQAELARELGISRSMISMWEQGNVRIPIDLLPRLARVLDTTPNQLLGWDEMDDPLPVVCAPG